MRRRILALAVCAALAIGLLSGCGGGETADAGETAAEVVERSVSGTAAAVAEEGTVIAFSEAGADIRGTGAEIADDGDVRITQAGTYTVTGTSSSGRVVVDADDADEVILVLAGCDLTYAEDEVIYVKNAGSAAVVLAEGTENVLTSGVEPETTDDDTEDDEASGAALRAKCDLTVSGAGTLAVYGYINNGVAATGDLVLESGDITVTAVNDGLKSKSDVTIAGGTLKITAGHDGIQADGALTVADGDITVVTGCGADEADMKTGDSFLMEMASSMMGSRSRREASGETDEAADDETVDKAVDETDGTIEAEDTETGGKTASGEMGGSREMSAWDDWMDAWDGEDSGGSRKGLKAETAITIAGGTLRLDTEEDAIHSNGDVTVSGGDIVIRAGDDGVHGETSVAITGGSLDVQLCFEGLEAQDILITDGYVNIVAVDDGMNANGGSGMFGGRGSVSGEASGEEEDGDTGNPTLRITGGVVYVDSGGDGLDSNGDLYIEGGLVCVSGPSTDWDAAMDSGDRGCEMVISGGTVLAAGYAGMAEVPDATDGSQPFIYCVISDYCEDGDTVKLLDADGNVVCEYAFTHGFNCVILSSPELVVGETYTLVMGAYETTVELTGTSWSNRSMGGMMGGMMGGRREASGEASGETEGQ